MVKLTEGDQQQHLRKGGAHLLQQPSKFHHRTRLVFFNNMGDWLQWFVDDLLETSPTASVNLVNQQLALSPVRVLGD